MLDQFAGVLELAPVGDALMSLDGEHEAVRHLRRPFAKGGGRLGAIERTVHIVFAWFPIVNAYRDLT